MSQPSRLPLHVRIIRFWRTVQGELTSTTVEPRRFFPPPPTSSVSYFPSFPSRVFLRFLFRGDICRGDLSFFASRSLRRQNRRGQAGKGSSLDKTCFLWDACADKAVALVFCNGFWILRRAARIFRFLSLSSGPILAERDNCGWWTIHCASFYFLLHCVYWTYCSALIN